MTHTQKIGIFHYVLYAFTVLIFGLLIATVLPSAGNLASEVIRLVSFVAAIYISSAIIKRKYSTIPKESLTLSTLLLVLLTAGPFLIGLIKLYEANVANPSQFIAVFGLVAFQIALSTALYYHIGKYFLLVRSEKILHIALILIIASLTLLYAQNTMPVLKSLTAALEQQQNITSQIYKSDLYNFSISYPSNWELEGNTFGPSGVSLSDKRENISISYAPSLEEFSMSAPLNKRHTLREALSYELTNIEEFPIGGEIGYIGTFTNPVINLIEKHVWVEHRGNAYQISFRQLTPDIEKILASFTFLK